MPAIKPDKRALIELFIVSLISLYFELLIIRWLSCEIRIFAYFKNIPLMACLFGLGLGLALPVTTRDIRKLFPFGLLSIVVLICLAEPLHLVHITFINPMENYLIGDFVSQGTKDTLLDRLLLFLPGLAVLTAVFYLIVFTFMSLGQRIGRLMDEMPSLPAYSLNVGASLLGILLYSAVCFLGWQPAVWLLIGVALSLPFFRVPSQIASLIAALIIAFATSSGNVIWSPYYRLSLDEVWLAADQGRPAANYGYNIQVNYDTIEGAYNNARSFLSKLTPAQLKGTADYYDTPYLALGDAPRSILILASGTGNDVAAALRHGATDIDAVEIDPSIVTIGRRLHPEKPYLDSRVHVIVDDARAYMRRTRKRYDLVVFAYLDSHTAFSSMSSLRLDNYVYTRESFEDAARLLKPKGAISVTFYYLNWWQLAHVYKALQQGTGQEPLGVYSPQGNGPTLLIGTVNLPATAAGLKRFSIDSLASESHISRDQWDRVLPTLDDWPFLFLKDRSVSWTYGIGLLFTLMLGYRLVGACFGKFAFAPQGLTMFFLGAAFMLIETKSVTQMGLLLGTTWIVNSAVVAGILIMILAANIIQMKARLSNVPALFACLLVSLFLNWFIPLSAMNALPGLERYLLGTVFLCLPLLFAAMIFAEIFCRVDKPGNALGMNLLGSLVGGLLEYLSMVSGVNALNLLAAGLYFMAFLSWRKWKASCPTLAGD